jgi:hypothetical protein
MIQLYIYVAQILNELYNIANQELVKLNNWFCANKLAINIKKTKYAICETQNQCNQIPNELTLSINNLKLTRICNHQAEDSVKFPGIHMDENLTWRNHVVSVGTKLARSIFSLNIVKHILPFDILRTLYFTLVQSNIMPGLIVWGNTCFVNKIFYSKSELFVYSTIRPFGHTLTHSLRVITY